MFQAIGGEAARQTTEIMSDVLLACCKYHFPVLNTTIRVYLNTDGYPSDRAQPQDKQNFLKTLMRCEPGEGNEVGMVVGVGY